MGESLQISTGLSGVSLLFLVVLLSLLVVVVESIELILYNEKSVDTFGETEKLDPTKVE